MSENEIAAIVVDESLAIHRKLGSGLFESVYQNILAYQLRKRGLRVELEVPVIVTWDGQSMDIGFKIDLLVEDKLIVELKSIQALAPIHSKQVLTYLRLANKRLGLLINFGQIMLKDQIVRLANGLDD